MQITIAHNKGQKEAMRIVDKSLDDLIHSIPVGPVKIVDPEKSWNSNTMSFSFKGKMGFFGTTIRGTVQVNENNVVIEVELPGMVKQLVPEDKVRAAVESKAKLLLA